MKKDNQPSMSHAKNFHGSRGPTLKGSQERSIETGNQLSFLLSFCNQHFQLLSAKESHARERLNAWKIE